MVIATVVAKDPAVEIFTRKAPTKMQGQFAGNDVEKSKEYKASKATVVLPQDSPPWIIPRSEERLQSLVILHQKCL